MKTTVAVVQAAPVYMDCKATVAKACELIAEAASRGARLLVLPEAFVPCYPTWVWSIPPSENRVLADLYGELIAQSITVPGPYCDQLCNAARAAEVYVAIGVNERNAEAGGGSLYNTILYIRDDGTVLGRHRKLVPTAPERMIWAPGDGSTLGVHDTPLGRLGALTCWENYMPLARYALYARGVQLYLAPTFDEGEPWLSTLRHIAKEGRVYVLGCCMVLRTEDIPDRFGFKTDLAPGAWLSEGDSAVVGPDGDLIAGPLNKSEGILYADVDLDELNGSKWKLDVAGHYARPDVFEFRVRTSPRPIMSVVETPAPEPGTDPMSSDQ